MLQLSPVCYYDNSFEHHASWQHTVPLASAVVLVADTSKGKSADITA